MQAEYVVVGGFVVNRLKNEERRGSGKQVKVPYLNSRHALAATIASWRGT